MRKTWKHETIPLFEYVWIISGQAYNTSFIKFLLVPWFWALLHQHSKSIDLSDSHCKIGWKSSDVLLGSLGLIGFVGLGMKWRIVWWGEFLSHHQVLKVGGTTSEKKMCVSSGKPLKWNHQREILQTILAKSSTFSLVSISPPYLNFHNAIGLG